VIGVVVVVDDVEHEQPLVGGLGIVTVGGLGGAGTDKQV
jgi:hypothetical protein